MRYLILAYLTTALLVAGCGGKSSARPATDPVPERGQSGRNASRRTALQPAVRLDQPIGSPGGAGVHHTLHRGQTLYSLSRIYRVPVATLMRVNGITDPSSIPAGTPILIPGVPGAATKGEGRDGAGRPAAASAPSAAPTQSTALTQASTSILDLAWPLAGRITAPFGSRSGRPHHDGIDIDGFTGETITAVARGIVLRAGADGKYGKIVVLDHGGGLTTLYAHASRLLVREGDVVTQGDPIAEVGRTGNARGTHLHFEMRQDGHPVDPIPLLRSGALQVTRPQP